MSDVPLGFAPGYLVRIQAYSAGTPSDAVLAMISTALATELPSPPCTARPLMVSAAGAGLFSRGADWQAAITSAQASSNALSMAPILRDPPVSSTRTTLPLRNHPDP